MTDDIPLSIADGPDPDDPFPDGFSDPDTAEQADTADDDDGIEPVEYLVKLAKDDKIDPWDIDIVSVTEEFLDALDDGDLRASGRALFYASVLLRMKGDTLVAPDEPEEPEPEPWEAPLSGGDREPDVDPIDGLEAEMERRLQRKSVRGKPETLDELVRELRDAERDSWWKSSREYDTSDSPRGHERGTQTLDYRVDDEFRGESEPTEAAVTEKTHGEDIETIIDDVWSVVADQYDAGRTEVLYAEIDDAGGSRVMTYLALLFLANRGTIKLRQTELFGDLWIQDPDADRGAEEAIAD